MRNDRYGSLDGIKGFALIGIRLPARPERPS